MRRREFLSALTGMAAAWPCLGHAQQPDRVRRVGVLIALAEADPQAQLRVKVLRADLRVLGWIDGQNIRIDFRFADGNVEHTRKSAAELARSGADVIIANSSPILSAVQRESRTIPIVFVQVADPVGGGFVKSLPKPGGNVTA